MSGSILPYLQQQELLGVVVLLPWGWRGQQLPLPWVVVGVVLMQLAWVLLLLHHRLRLRGHSWQMRALGPERMAAGRTAAMQCNSVKW
jgi:hypothetical protein